MDNNRDVTVSSPEQEAVGYLLKALDAGRDWPTSLLETMGRWSAPREIYKGRQYDYFVGGEAFDWLLLAERLCLAADRKIPKLEKEALLFTGQFPTSFDESQFKNLLGVQKYRGHLNFLYGVMVEEALQLAVENEVQKHHLSNGNQYQHEFSDEVYVRIYGKSKTGMLEKFWEGKGHGHKQSITMAEATEFTYWLFKHRINTSDKAKIASDTRKGIKQIQKMIPVGSRADGDQWAHSIYEAVAPGSAATIPPDVPYPLPLVADASSHLSPVA